MNLIKVLSARKGNKFQEESANSIYLDLRFIEDAFQQMTFCLATNFKEENIQKFIEFINDSINKQKIKEVLNNNIIIKSNSISFNRGFYLEIKNLIKLPDENDAKLSELNLDEAVELKFEEDKVEEIEKKEVPKEQKEQIPVNKNDYKGMNGDWEFPGDNEASVKLMTGSILLKGSNNKSGKLKTMAGSIVIKGNNDGYVETMAGDITIHGVNNGKAKTMAGSVIVKGTGGTGKQSSLTDMESPWAPWASFLK